VFFPECIIYQYYTIICGLALNPNFIPFQQWHHQQHTTSLCWVAPVAYSAPAAATPTAAPAWAGLPVPQGVGVAVTETPAACSMATPIGEFNG